MVGLGNEIRRSSPVEVEGWGGRGTGFVRVQTGQIETTRAANSSAERAAWGGQMGARDAGPLDGRDGGAAARPGGVVVPLIEGADSNAQWPLIPLLQELTSSTPRRAAPAAASRARPSRAACNWRPPPGGLVPGGIDAWAGAGPRVLGNNQSGRGGALFEMGLGAGAQHDRALAETPPQPPKKWG